MLLSFIVPLYNCEKYIGLCMETILNADARKDNYEIIIVNDGSHDQGPAIVQDYARKYNCISLLNQQNKGASAARNTGMDAAKGDYIWFVDADDLIVPSFLQKVYQYLDDENVELLCFNHQKLHVTGKTPIDDFKTELHVTGVEFFKGHYSNFIWNKIYKVSAIKGKRFLDGTKNIEDMHFNMCTVIDMKHVMCVPEYGYQYNCMNMESTSRRRDLRNLMKLDQDSITIIRSLKEFADKQTDKEKRYVLMDNLNETIAGHLYSLFVYYSPRRLKKRISDYKVLEKYPVQHCRNKRANRFLLIANREQLFLFAMRLLLWMKSYYKKFTVNCQF